LTRGRHEEGFTLFELLIVIIILAILSAIVVFSVGSSRANALTSSCQSDAKAFGSALEQYNAQVGSYPPLGPLLTTPPTPYTWLTTTQVVAGGQTVGPFLREMPSSTHYQLETDGNGGVFVYPAGQANKSASLMEQQTVGGLGGTTNPGALLNFETDPGICSNPFIVQ
jgi:prepilin-type N-terminal cleavage/methylation domain-containing protein